MRLFIPAILILILASCGALNQSGQLRLVKVDKQVVPIIVKNEIEQKQTICIENQKTNLPNTELALKKNDTSEEIEMQGKTSHAKGGIVKQEQEDMDPDAEDEEANQEIVNQAVRAEKHARISLGLFIAGLVSILLPYLGVIFFIIGLIVYSKAKASRYITPYGENKLNTSRTFLILDAVILSLWFLLILFLLLLLLL